MRMRPATRNPIPAFLCSVILMLKLRHVVAHQFLCLPGSSTRHLPPPGLPAQQPADQSFETPERIELSIAKVFGERGKEQQEDMPHLRIGVKRHLFKQQRAYRE